MSNSNLIFDFGNVLGRSEMKKITAGSGSCYYCLGGIQCESGAKGGWTGCDETGYPDYTCDFSGSRC